MRAVDTNVLVRYYLRDDPAQARLAEGVLSAGAVFVPKTVVLELEWVLRSVAEQPTPSARAVAVATPRKMDTLTMSTRLYCSAVVHRWAS